MKIGDGPWKLKAMPRRELLVSSSTPHHPLTGAGKGQSQADHGRTSNSVLASTVRQ